MHVRARVFAYLDCFSRSFSFIPASR
ncbi:hypothetical protein AGR8A_Lc10679 [Agrobacterium fabrum str. J-07]|nr:hypothetical protein AGR8A_Lc10679 [Agrobacterium fabrum str. J-07]